MEKWGISSVEIAGFFEFEAVRLYKELTNYHMKVCSIVAPPFTKGRDFSFYCEWVDKFPPIFETNTVILQSLPENFIGTETGIKKTCDVLGELIVKIALKLDKSNVRVSYHCFPHDFQLVDGQSFVSRLFARSDTPDNLGLQLDTYWLSVSGIAPSTYANLPVHSVHLNERDEQGRNCLLGTNKNKCVKYIRPLIKRESPINWIIENDSADGEAKSNDVKMMNTLHQCIVSWPKFWDSLKSVDESPEKEHRATPTPVAVKPKFVNKPISNYEVYEQELNDVLTEYLFGNDPYLNPIDIEYPTLKYYVDKRKSSAGKYHDEKFYAERLLFPSFWPSAKPGKQVIHIVGGAGAGKSTFIRFFFQHFLPFYETIVNNADTKSDMAETHAAAFRRHLLLYVNLRRGMTTDEIRPYLYNQIGDRLARAAIQLGFTIDSKDGEQYSESWVKRQISRLAKEVEDNERKWYISWILDNSDLMQETAQKDLINLLFEWIPEVPSNIFPNTPVLAGSCLELWRIIIPIRPETLTGLAPDWSPLHNRNILYLDPIDHDLLFDNRAEYLFQKVLNSTKSPFVDLWEFHPDSNKPAYPRAQFDMVVAREKAPEMQESLRIAYGGKSEISNEDDIPNKAKSIFDQIVNDSARRRLYLVRKVFSSNIFHTRQRQKRLSAFYFLEGLIRGDNKVFQPNDPENLVLNLYSLGDDPKSDPYSIFVGLHSTFFLNQGKQWKDVKSILEKIGYPAKHLLQCEIYLKGKELIREVAGIWRVELPIVKGHWALLTQRSYTDNMAVACAIAWGSQEEAVPTNPLYRDTLLTRFTSSLWFLKKIWEAEYEMARYPSDTEIQNSCGTFQAFSEFRKALNLPFITNAVAQEYLNKMKGLPDWLSPKSAIMAQKNTWDSNMRELEKLVKKSGEPNVLDARR